MKPVSFYLVTDTHYFENELGAEGKSFEKNMLTEQYFVKESSAIVKSTLQSKELTFKVSSLLCIDTNVYCTDVFTKD